MNLEKTILHQRLVIGLLLILLIFITLCCYKYELQTTAVMIENEKLNKQIEYQQSVIMDLEEYLKEK